MIQPSHWTRCRSIGITFGMRAHGHRLIKVWVSDVRSPEFAAEARRQSALVAAADRTSDDMDFVDAISEDWNA